MGLNNIGYLTKEGFKGIFKHGFMSFASVTIIMACLIIMGVFALLALNINGIINQLEAQNEIVAFVDEAYTNAEAQDLKNAVLSVDNVEAVEFVSRQQAMNNFAEEYEEGLFDEIDASVFRDRYIIHVEDIELTEQTQKDLMEVEGIVKVNAHLDYADGFIQVRNVTSLICIVLIAILAIVSVFIMSNTIKLATFTRREEIAIMRMVGATNGFIRWPFVYEGFMIGFLGAVIAFGLQWALYAAVARGVDTNDTLQLIQIIPFQEMWLPVALTFGGAGILVGVGGSLSAIRKFLQV